MTATAATRTPAHPHSDRARRFFETFKNTSLDEMLGVQRAYIEDYKRWKAEGDGVMAEITLDRCINPLGEAIDMRDGTCRECAEERA